MKYIYIIIAICILIFNINIFAQSEDQIDKVKITVMIFSGLEDPTFILEDNSLIERINTLISESRLNENYSKKTVIPSRLGYKGLIIEYISQDRVKTEYIIYNNNIEKNQFINERIKTQFRSDSSDSIESLLLDEALKTLTINDDLFNIIENDRSKLK